MKNIVYVAAGFQHYERARSLIDMIKDLGFQISFDWTRTPAFDFEGHLQESPQSDREDREYAINDVWGVESADILVFMGDTDPYGGLMELGMAMRNVRKRVLVVRPSRNSIFFRLPNVTVFQSYSDLRAHLKDLQS